MFRNKSISRRRFLNVLCCSDCVHRAIGSSVKRKVIVYVPSCSARDGSTMDTSSCESRAAHSPNHSQDAGTLGASAKDSSSTKDDIPSTQIAPQEDNSLAVRSYAVDSYRKFGVWKGTVLTGWRLMRCNPWGGRGYDPPAWPPKGLESMYRQNDSFDVAPKVTVCLGTALIVYLVNSMIQDLGFNLI